MVKKMNFRIKPPHIALVYLIIFVLLNKLFPALKIVSNPYNLFGIVFILIGILIVIWAANAFTRKDTPKNPFDTPKAVATDGPFKHSRNPMYIGITYILIGASILNGSALVFLAPIVFLITIRIFFIPMEEKKMERLFGEEYLNYKKKVRRWI